MSHYEERLEQDLLKIKKRVRETGQQIQRAVQDATQAALEVDKRLANSTILQDAVVNRSTDDIEDLCHAFIVRHVPSAGHLRFVSAALRLNVALERIGDYAVTMCRETILLSAKPPPTIARDIELLGHQAQRILSQTLKAFDTGDVELARNAMGMADQVGATFQKVFEDLIDAGGHDTHPIKDLFALLFIMQNLRRVSAQADNICELTVFSVMGETRRAKVHRVLFVDERNDALSQIAEAVARKGFPNSGQFDSAGWKPASELHPALPDFLDRYGYDDRDHTPKLVQPFTPGRRHYHVIVSLQHDVRPHLDEVPFRTVLLEWDVGPQPDVSDRKLADAALESAYPQILHEVRNLMEILGGPDAH